MDISLAGQVAVVTGARRGLGRSHALELARCGAAVVVNGTPASDGLEDVVAEIEREGGRAVASARTSRRAAAAKPSSTTL